VTVGFLTVHQIRFQSHGGTLQRSPDSLAGLRSHTSKGEREGGTRERERIRGGEWNGMDRPLAIPGSTPETETFFIIEQIINKQKPFYSYLLLP